MPTIDFATVPSGVIISDERINFLNARAAETHAAFTRRIQSLMEKFAEARDNYSREADSLVGDETDPATRATAKQFARRRLLTQLSKYRQALIEASAKDRSAMLAQLKAFADEAQATGAVLASPAAMLGRVALGDPRKTQLIEQLTGAGPMELETAARTAIMSGDLVLASALALVVDRKPRDARPFRAGDLALRVMGDQFKDVSDKLHAVLMAYKTAQAADLEFIRGKPDPITNISLALGGLAEAQT